MTSRDEVISGAREVDQLFQTLPANVEKNIMRGALRAGAAVFLEEVKPRIPAASGQLRASARVTSRYRRGEVSASVKVGNFVAWYAHLVEFGTRPHTIKSKTPGGALRIGGARVRSVEHPGIRAQPFMRPAADAAFPAAVAAVHRKIRERLTQRGLSVPEAISDPSE